MKSLNSARHLATMLETGLSQIINRRDLTTRAKFDEMLRTLKQIKQIPSDLVTGKNIKISQPTGCYEIVTININKYRYVCGVIVYAIS